MGNGRRYDTERKLNMKKVVGVIVAFAVVIMCIISIQKLLEPKEEAETKKAYFSAYQKGKWGVINQAGEEVIPFNYDEMIIVPDSSKDIFITMQDVDLSQGTYQTKVLNKNQEEQFTSYEQVEAIDNYDTAQNLWYETVLKVKKDGKYGLINMSGKEVLSCQYDEITSLKGTKNTFLIKQGEKVGIANNVGEIIVPVDYAEITAFGQEYLAGYRVKNVEGKQGLIGTNKKVILEANYDEIKPISGNSFYVVKEAGIWKIINEAKETIIENNFDDVLQIDGENFVLKRGEKVGVITTSKEEKIPFEYQEIKSIGNNYFIAKKENQYGVIDGSNQTKVEFQYTNIFQRKDTDFIEAEKNSYETDIYNKDMQLQVTGIVSEVNTEKGYIAVRVGEEQKYYNFKFEEKKEQDLFPEHTLFLVKKDGKYGYQDKNGNLVVDCIYDDAREQNAYGYCSVKKGNVWGSLNQEGNVVQEPSINLDTHFVIDFIGKWYLGEDLNLHYYQSKN